MDVNSCNVELTAKAASPFNRNIKQVHVKKEVLSSKINRNEELYCKISQIT